MHLIYYNYAPVSFNETWLTNIQNNANYNLRNANDFILPNPRIDQFKKFPIYSLPYEWNHCGDLKFYDNLITFKMALRDQLFFEIGN